jgi:hypothetical protein
LRAVGTSKIIKLCPSRVLITLANTHLLTPFQFFLLSVWIFSFLFWLLFVYFLHSTLFRKRVGPYFRVSGSEKLILDA